MKKILKTLTIATALIGLFGVMPASHAQEVAKAPSTEQAIHHKVNINQASAEILAERLNGIGEKKAQAIIEYRNTNGPFKSVDELKNVSGIGEATLEKNRALLSVE